MPIHTKFDVGIIMPVFNRENTIVDAIASVLAQTFEDWHLLIVDDGSDASIAEFLTSQRVSDPRISIIRQQNGGVGAARNAGLDILARADSRFFGFLDADDIWHPQKLELQLNYLDQHPNVGAISSPSLPISNDIRYEDCSFSTIRQVEAGASPKQSVLYEDLTTSLLTYGFTFCPASVLVRSYHLSTFRYYPSRAGEDLLPFLSLGLKHVPFVKILVPLYFERTFADSLQRSPQTSFLGHQTFVETIAKIRADNSNDQNLVQLCTAAQDRYIFALLWCSHRFMSATEIFKTARHYVPQISSITARLVASVKILAYWLVALTR